MWLTRLIFLQNFILIWNQRFSTDSDNFWYPDQILTSPPIFFFWVFLLCYWRLLKNDNLDPCYVPENSYFFNIFALYFLSNTFLQREVAENFRNVHIWRVSCTVKKLSGWPRKWPRNRRNEAQILKFHVFLRNELKWTTFGPFYEFLFLKRVIHFFKKTKRKIRWHCLPKNWNPGDQKWHFLTKKSQKIIKIWWIFNFPIDSNVFILDLTIWRVVKHKV